MINLITIFKAFFVRAALTLHCLLAVWRVVVMLDDDTWWYLALALVPLVIEGLITICRRQGVEFKWFTPCFLFYLLAVLPCIWLLELDKNERYQDGRADELEVVENTTVSGGGTTLEINLNPNTWTLIIEEALLYLLIISRWLLPRGKVTREQLSELLFAFIGIASDVMEMLALFGENGIRDAEYMAYWILGVWSLSIFQFTMTLTVSHRPRRGKNIRVITEQPTKKMEVESIRAEIGAILLSMFMQDVPFFALRMYAMITFDLITYSLVFFTGKNFLVISLLIYKIAVLIQKRYCPELTDDDDDEEIVIGDESKDKKKKKGKKNSKETSFVEVDLGDGEMVVGDRIGTNGNGELKKRNGKGLNNNNDDKNNKKQKPKDNHIAVSLQPSDNNAFPSNVPPGDLPVGEPQSSNDAEFDAQNAGSTQNLIPPKASPDETLTPSLPNSPKDSPTESPVSLSPSDETSVAKL